MPASRALLLLTLGLGVASAQVGYPGGYPPSYPGQTPYPGGGRGGGSGIPFPIPGRGGSNKKSDPKSTTSKTPPEGLANFRGTLKQMDEKSIALEMGDNRVLDFKRTSKTKFFKAGEETQTPGFHAGDQLSVEATQDPTGYLTAVNVYWERAASKDSTKNDGAVDTWKDAPAGAPKPADGETPTKEVSAERAPPPARADPDDPGPPRLSRGGPADPSRQRAATPPAVEPSLSERNADNVNISRPVIRPLDDDNRDITRLRSTDDLIRRAADAALDFTAGLPAYVCQEVVSRFQSETQKPNWQAIDVLTTNLVYENGKEDYRDITLNGKPLKGKVEETGAWSTGEFGSMLMDLFSPATNAEFHFQRDTRVAGMSTKMYDFSVAREGSHWSIHAAAQSYLPAYKGSVWIDPQNARVLRIEMQANKFPQDFPFDHVESATDYQYIRLGDTKQYLLPVHSETLTCQRGSYICSRNVIDFRNYHKYSGESNITFGAPK